MKYVIFCFLAIFSIILSATHSHAANFDIQSEAIIVNDSSVLPQRSDFSPANSHQQGKHAFWFLRTHEIDVERLQKKKMHQEPENLLIPKEPTDPYFRHMNPYHFR